MPEVGFDREERRATGAYLRLKDGERAIVRMLSLPVKFRDHWLRVDGRSVICPKKEKGECPICDGSRYTREEQRQRVRFVVAFYVHALSFGVDAAGKPRYEKLGEVRTFEGTDTVRDLLADAVNEIDGDWQNNDLTISRKGEGLETKYSVLPRKKSDPVPDGIDVPDVLNDVNERIESALKTGVELDATSTTRDGEDVVFGDPFADE